MVDPKNFQKEISPYFSTKSKRYLGALITNDCWQAIPGKVVDLISNMGISAGGRIVEDCKVLEVMKEGSTYSILALTHDKKYVEFRTEIFVNALGAVAGKICE